MASSIGTCKYEVAFTCWFCVCIVLIGGSFTIHLEAIERLDRLILEWFSLGRSVTCDQFFVYVSWSGSSFLLVPVILIHAVLLLLRSRTQESLFLVASFTGISLLSRVVKLVIARQRPELFTSIIEIPDGFSFPSSHAVQITAFVLAELLLLRHSVEARWLTFLSIIGGLLILLVCISRMYLQVHYPSDVVAGFLTASFWVIGLATLMLPNHQNRTIPMLCWTIGKGK
jgi:undecaprenyl-diphosphatase